RRASSTRRASRALRASASAHLSTSPGGRTPSSSRRTPELPPLSNMVTTASACSQGFDFSPPNRLGRPVPPPKHPTRSLRRRMARHSTIDLMSVPESVAALERDLRGIFAHRLRSLVAYAVNEPPADG